MHRCLDLEIVKRAEPPQGVSCRFLVNLKIVLCVDLPSLVSKLSSLWIQELRRLVLGVEAELGLLETGRGLALFGVGASGFLLIQDETENET